MKVRLVTNLMVAFLTLAMGGAAFAHHGAAAYDTAKSVTVKGTVTDFQFTNPHVLIFIDSKDEGGNVQKWQGELTSPNHLARAGWTKSTIKVGDQITLTGNPANSGASNLWLRKVLSSSGTEIKTGGGEN
jgi:hypothetical protein